MNLSIFVLRRTMLYAILLSSFLGLSLLWGPVASADPVDGAADTVFGQLNFTSAVENSGGLSDSSLSNATDVAVDASGNVYVADASNNRVLIYLDPKNTDTVADIVLGQPNFVSSACNSDGSSPSASTLCDPRGLALDSAGNLYVADWQNSRILVYIDPLDNTVADAVIGQPDFTTIDFNLLFPSDINLFLPKDVAVDNSGNVFIADTNYNRVTVYFDPLNTDTMADMVLGQPGFTTGTANNGGVSSISLSAPTDVEVDAAGNVFVVDTNNSRVLVYSNLISTTNVEADTVFGQSDFTSNSCNKGNPGPSDSSLCSPSRMTIDTLENVYIGDSDNNRVLEYHTPLTSDTVADAVLGQLDFTSSVFATTASNMANPQGVAIDTDGDIYVADRANYRVLIFDGTPPVTTTMLTGICFDPPFATPLSLKKNSKRVIPLKMTLINSEGVEITDADLSAPPVVNVLFGGQVYGEVPPDSEELLPTGGANTDNIFRFENSKWIYNLGTKQFSAPGIYTVKAVAGDGSYIIDGCMQTFERLD